MRSFDGTVLASKTTKIYLPNWLSHTLKFLLYAPYVGPVRQYIACTAKLALCTVRILGCANKDLDGFLGPLCKFIEYCRIVALLPVIPLGIMNNW